MCKIILQKAFLMLSIFIIFSFALNAQTSLKVTGSVSDESGGSLPGVSIYVKGSSTGTITDIDGKFSVNVSGEKSILVVSYLGYRSQEIEIGKQRIVKIHLEEDSKSLDEVVVIGYGSVKKKDLTGALSSVQGDAIAGRKTTQISQALQGAMSGVTVTRSNGSPGASTEIKIRGVTTIGDSNPLIIVDGIPVDNIDDINPNDVESMTVLKDAASASIYGSRAAAGVILVTTKRAKIDQFNVEYNFETGIEKPTRLPEYVNAQRYMQMSNELGWNDAGNGTNEYPTYPKDIVDNYLELNKEDPNSYPVTDWTKLIMRPYAPRQSHVLRITGGSQKLKTAASIAYDNTDGLYEQKEYQRFTSRVNNDLTINKYITARVDVNFKRTTSINPTTDPMYFSRMAAPIYAGVWSDGRLANGKDGANAYGIVKYGGTDTYWYTQFAGQIGLDVKPFDGLKLTANFSPTYNFTKRKTFKKAVPWYTAEDENILGGYLSGATTTDLYEERNDNYRTTLQFLANYTKSIKNHSFDVLAGFEEYYSNNENLKASREQYLLTTFPYLNQGPETYRDNAGSAWENAYQSFFGRVMYNYKNRYLMQANIRYDASSRFYSEYRWGAFPSASLGWVVSEESFMKNINSISFLKLRASYGSLGNERIGNYPYQATIAFSEALFYQGDVVVSQQTAAQQKYAIQDISWETTETFDVGFDASFFDNRLKFTGDYYQKNTKDMLLAIQIPMFLGFENPDQNTGKMTTNGWEIDLGWNDKIGDLKYSVTANMSDYHSKMGNLGGTEFLGDQIKKEGSEFNEWYGYKAAGIYQTQDQVDNSAKTSSSVKVGDIRYEDISGPDGVPDGVISSEYDRVLLGGSLPRYLYGGTINLEYKGIDLGLVFQGVGKQLARLTPNMVKPLVDNWGNIPAIIEGKYWSHYNTEEQNMAASYPRLTLTNQANNYAMSDFWLFDGSYFRLKNVTLGYTLPKSVTEKVQIQTLRIFGSITDFFSVNKFPVGWDPENGSSSYPITTSFIAGISIKF